MDESLYEKREQSYVKHRILERYLLQMALIIGSKWNSITYVDCFSGPWKSKSQSFEDTSFAIAIRQLKEAKKVLAEQGKTLQLRAFFTERNKGSFSQLKEFAANVAEIEIEVHNAEFEVAIERIQSFIARAPSPTFPFIFIDPTGWTGFALDVIRPLLQLPKCEVLINFMTQHIVRFIDCEESQASFERLFGKSGFANSLQDKVREDRVDAAVFQYRDVVSQAGNFKYPGISAVLNPVKDRSHFHLIYLSGHPKGLEVFKRAEKSSMDEMEKARARVEQSNRESKTRQRDLFAAIDAPESKYFRTLRDRYRNLAVAEVEIKLAGGDPVSYDTIWQAWLRYPLAWESDLKEWVEKSDHIRIEGLTGRQRVPQRGKSHFLRNARND